MVSFKNCFLERIVDLVMGVVLLGIGLSFIVVGLTILPVIGLFPAIPVLVFSIIFLKAPPAPSCSLA